MTTHATDPLIPPEPDGEIAVARTSEAVGIPGFPGPYEVGRYAKRLREQLRSFTKVSLIGEVSNVRIGSGAKNVYFELRDGEGAVPCTMWRNEFDRSGIGPDGLKDGAQVLVAGGCDFYPGSARSSPSFSFRVNAIKLAGEGDLLAQLDRLRRQLASEGLFELQKRLRISALPRTIGVVTAEGSAARRDFLAGLERRGWSGTIVWGYAPVQDRRAAPAIIRAISDLALLEQVETIVVTRGGGSIADLWAFCDEALCRTVALLATPVISAVGHETDRTLIDDVSAFSCSTPTHAADVAVRTDCGDARRRLARDANRLGAAGRGSVVTQARRLVALSRAPRDHLARHRRELRQTARELRAVSGRRVGERIAFQARVGSTVLGRKLAAALAGIGRDATALRSEAASLDRAAARVADRRRETLDRLAAAIDARDPQRTLERGYALALGPDGEPLAGADAIRTAGDFDLRMADGTVPSRVRRAREVPDSEAG
jgi:exodeoxyribonuclease VII large subunit